MSRIKSIKNKVMKIYFNGKFRDVQVFPAPKTAFMEDEVSTCIYHPEFLCFLQNEFNDLECRAFYLDENMIDNRDHVPTISTKMSLRYFKKVVENKMRRTDRSESICAKETYDEMVELGIPYDKETYDYVFDLPDWRDSE